MSGNKVIIRKYSVLEFIPLFETQRQQSRAYVSKCIRAFSYFLDKNRFECHTYSYKYTEDGKKYEDFLCRNFIIVNSNYRSVFHLSSDVFNLVIKLRKEVCLGYDHTAKHGKIFLILSNCFIFGSI